MPKPTPGGDSCYFLEVEQNWDLQRLLKDIEDKETKKLTPAQQRNLQAILLGLSPKETAQIVKVEEKSLKPAFSALYRLIENLRDQTHTSVTYKNAPLVLAGYRRGVMLPNTAFELLGREDDRTALQNLSKQHKIVLIKAGAGVGKSTLAREFLETQFKKVIRLEMGLEAGNVTPADEKVAQILRKDFDEEPSRDFGTNLETLKAKLSDRANPIGVLLDNLEPALDEGYRFREMLRGYENLLQVLCDRGVCSFTLITSRRSLIAQRVTVREYPLEGLNITAWQQHFHDCKNAETSESLTQMCKAYNGNAKVMNILYSAITNRFKGNIESYWNRYQNALLADPELETLISVEMDWLRDHQSDAYKLLCRMGCYRYQDVQTVPFEGLICLLWDVPKSRRAWVVEYLSKTSLIEVKGEYHLHPAVREATQSILINAQEDKKETDLQAAEFLKDKISIIKTIEDTLLGFEVIYHYLEANNFEKAASIIIELKGDSKDIFDNFGFVCWRFGFSQKIISAISSILKGRNYINDAYVLSGLYRIIGYAEHQLGNIRKAIKYYELSGNAINECFNSIKSSEEDLYHSRMVEMICSCFFNTGLRYIDLWELEIANDYFERIYRKFNRNRYWFEDQCCLSFIKSCLGYLEEAKEFTERVQKEYYEESMSAWGRIYTLLFIGRIYKNLGDIAKAVEVYQLALSIAIKTNYSQAKANALSYLGEAYREIGNLNLSYSHHLEAITLLQYLGAKSDFAEACFQLGLTYQAREEYDQAEVYKMKALELFTQMEAPKQIERVNKTFDRGAMK